MIKSFYEIHKVVPAVGAEYYLVKGVTEVHIPFTKRKLFTLSTTVQEADVSPIGEWSTYDRKFKTSNDAWDYIKSKMPPRIEIVGRTRKW